MKEFYTVGEVSKIFNIPTATLRYYDSIGLISPWKNGENGYRYYSKAQFEIISTIVLMRSLGTPLKKLTDILRDSDAEGIKGELQRYTSEIDKKIDELKILKAKANSLDKDINNACFKENVELVLTPKSYLMTKKFGIEDELDIDEILCANKQVSKWAATSSIISTISVDNLLRKNYHIYEEYGYMSEVNYPVKNSYCKVHPQRLCVCTNVRLHSVEHYEVDGAYNRMLDYIHENNLYIDGPAIERNVLSLYGEDDKNPIMFFKLYIPVKEKM